MCASCNNIKMVLTSLKIVQGIRRVGPGSDRRLRPLLINWKYFRQGVLQSGDEPSHVLF